MVSQKVVVRNKSGLHARPAGDLAKLCMSCSSNVRINFNERKVQPKSILNIMAACVKCGSEIEIICEGANEEEELKKIVDLIEGGFGEEIVIG